MRNAVLCFVLFINVHGQVIYNGQGHIPQNKQVNWTNAGLLPNSPTEAQSFFDVTDSEYGAVPNDGQNDFNAIHQVVDRGHAFTVLKPL